jgi:galactokinase
MGNQNQYIEDGQTTQWSKEKVQNDKQRSTKHAYKAKDQVKRTPLKTVGEILISSSSSYLLQYNMNCKNAHFIIYRVNVHLIGKTSFVNIMTDSVPLRKTVNTVQYIKIITGNCTLNIL